MGKYIGHIPQYLSTYSLSEDGNSITVPRGGLSSVLEILDEAQLETEVRDDQADKPVGKPYSFDKGFTLRGYQQEAVEAVLEHPTCLLQGAAGSGKTEIILAAISASNQKALIAVPTKKLFNQWCERITLRLGIPDKQIGKITGGRKKFIGDRITVATIASAKKMTDELKDSFGFLASDEVHRSASEQIFRFIDSISAKYRVGVSATIERRDKHHFLIHDLFGDIVFKVERDDLEKLGYLQSVKMLIVPTEFYFDYMNLDAIRTQCFSDVEFQTLSSRARSWKAKKLGLDDKAWPQYLAAVSADRQRNNLIWKHVKKELNKGNRCIIFVNRIEQCKMWEQAMGSLGIPIAVLWSGKSDRYETEMIKKLKTGEVKLAIGTTVDEGIDIPAMEVGFITYREAQNPQQIEQQAGRLARKSKGKNSARLYYFWDKKITAFKKDPKKLKKMFAEVEEIRHGEKIFQESSKENQAMAR